MKSKHSIQKRSRKTQKKVQKKTGSKSKSKPKSNCAPLLNGRTAFSGTCYNKDTLIQIKNAYNKNSKTPILDTDPQEIWNTLRLRLSQKCETEDCWLEEITDPSVRRQLDEIIFAPDHPKEWYKNPNEWLSNIDIEAVLQQYEMSHPQFKLLGPSSIDYDTQLSENGGKCVWEDLCRLSLDRLIDRGKTNLGISFNLDKHDEPGSHWVSMFVDTENGVIFYYDSALNPTPKEVSRLTKEIVRQGKSLDPPINFKCYKNRRAHQRTNTECGMYSLFFIITFLTGQPEYNPKAPKMTIQEKIDLFTKQSIPDKYVQKFRNIYFTSP